MGVSRDSYLAWLEKHRNLYQELVNISEVEDKIETLANKRSIVLMHLHAVLDENHIEIEGIKNMFGRPVELK